MNEGKNLLFTYYGLQDEQIKGAVTVVAYHFEVHGMLTEFFKPDIASACT
jgi:hypothetical protein